MRLLDWLSLTFASAAVSPQRFSTPFNVPQYMHKTMITRAKPPSGIFTIEKIDHERTHTFRDHWTWPDVITPRLGPLKTIFGGTSPWLAHKEIKSYLNVSFVAVELFAAVLEETYQCLVAFFMNDEWIVQISLKTTRKKSRCCWHGNPLRNPWIKA